MKYWFVIALLLPVMVLADSSGPDASAPALPELSPDARSILAAAESRARTAPESAEAWEALSRAQLAANRSGDAVDSAERAVRLARGWLPAHLTLARAYRARVPESGRYRQLILARQIRETLEAAVALEDTGAEAHFALMRYHLRAPAVLGGSRRTAARLARIVVERDRLRGALAQGLVAEHHDELAQAIAHYRDADAMEPPDPALRQLVVELLGQALIRSGDWNQALALYRRSIANQPGYGEAWYRIGEIAAETGLSLAEGASALKHYLMLPGVTGAPGLEQAHYQLGRIYAHKAHAEHARDQFRLALELDPGLSAARDAIEAL